MILDALTMVSGGINALNVITGQTVTGAGSVLSTNSIDLLQNRDIGEGKDVFMLFQPTVAFAGLTALDMQVISADDAALTTNVSVLGVTSAVPVALLGAGTRHYAEISGRLNSRGQRFLGARYVITGTGTAGALITSIVADIEDASPTKLIPSGFAVI
jgi:hypothetical protein